LPNTSSPNGAMKPWPSTSERAFAEYQTRIEQYCSSKHVPYLSADVSTPFDEIVLRALRRGGFLK